jgi:hypothetical protein
MTREVAMQPHQRSQPRDVFAILEDARSRCRRFVARQQDPAALSEAVRLAVALYADLTRLRRLLVGRAPHGEAVS